MTGVVASMLLKLASLGPVRQEGNLSLESEGISTIMLLVLFLIDL